MTRPPNLTSRAALFFLVLATGCTASGPTPPQVASDLSTPRSAALTFLRATAAGDVRTAKAACIGTPQEKQWVDAMSSFLTGLRDFDDAVVSRFGQEAVQADVQLKQALLELSDDVIQHVEEANVHESEETASLEPAAAGMRLRNRPPIYLRKDKGGWKVDLAATTQTDRRFDPEVKAKYQSAGAALHDAARQVRAGRYKTLAEAQRDADGKFP